MAITAPTPCPDSMNAPGPAIAVTVSVTVTVTVALWVTVCVLVIGDHGLEIVIASATIAGVSAICAMVLTVWYLLRRWLSAQARDFRAETAEDHRRMIALLEQTAANAEDSYWSGYAVGATEASDAPTPTARVLRMHRPPSSEN